MKNDIQDLKETLFKIAKDEIRISYCKSEETLSATDSKIGGRPAVPDDFIWPEYNGQGYCDDEPEKRRGSHYQKH